MTETPRPDPWKDVPLAIRREAHECATSNGRINPEYLAGLYRRGAQARTVVDHNGEVLTQAAVDRLLIDRGEQAETIRQQTEQIAGYLNRNGIAACGHYAVFTLQCTFEDGSERPTCMQCDRDAAQDRAEAAEARYATLTAALEQKEATEKREREKLHLEWSDRGGDWHPDEFYRAVLFCALDHYYDRTSNGVPYGMPAVYEVAFAPVVASHLGAVEPGWENSRPGKHWRHHERTRDRDMRAVRRADAARRGDVQLPRLQRAMSARAEPAAGRRAGRRNRRSPVRCSRRRLDVARIVYEGFRAGRRVGTAENIIERVRRLLIEHTQP